MFSIMAHHVHRLLVLADDIATILDDVALMTKVIAKKMAGVLGDDLALNAEQVSTVKAARELPVYVIQKQTHPCTFGISNQCGYSLVDNPVIDARWWLFMF